MMLVQRRRVWVGVRRWAAAATANPSRWCMRRLQVVTSHGRGRCRSAGRHVTTTNDDIIIVGCAAGMTGFGGKMVCGYSCRRGRVVSRHMRQCTNLVPQDSEKQKIL
jgi:hypothetical protein